MIPACYKRLTVACLAAAVLSCMEEGPSSEAGNPSVAGTVHNTSGLPVPGSRVLLYWLASGSPDSVAFQAPFRVDTMRTGPDGAFRFKSLPPGEYALEASGKEPGAAGPSLFSYRPEVEVPKGDPAFIHRDTLVLRPPGRVSGFARRDANPRPAGVVKDEDILVRVAGTERTAYTDTSGLYVLENVPEGIYRMSFVAADGHYRPALLDSVVVASGASVQPLPVVLAWSPFVAPPAPAGLTVTADSAAGLMRLQWSPVAIPRLSGYEVVRVDSAAARADTFSTADTVYVDTVGDLPPGRILGYTVHAVDSLGNRSPAPPSRRVSVPMPPDTTIAGGITALVLDGDAPFAAQVRLYSVPGTPGPLDSLTRRARLVTSSFCGADGKVAFPDLSAGLYSLEAVGPGGTKAFRAVTSPRKIAAPDTLRLAAPGSVFGRVSRQQLWCTDFAKVNGNIEVSLLGTPYWTATDDGGSFKLIDLPPGDYRVVIKAPPLGCFLPDSTAKVQVEAGKTDTLGTLVRLRFNPEYVPPVAGLETVSVSRNHVVLSWREISSAYQALAGYEVVRRDSTLAVLDTLEAARPPLTDDISAVRPGTRLNYMIRAVDKSGRRGRFGGDSTNRPVYLTVPGP